MRKTILTLVAALMAAGAALAQYNNIRVEGAPAFTAENHTYDFKCGGKTLRMVNEGHPVMMNAENDFGGHFLISLSVIDTKKPLYMRSVVDKRTGGMVGATQRDGRREVQYEWSGDSAREYVFWNTDGHGPADCVINKIDGRMLLDIGGVLYHFRAACPPDRLSGYRVVNDRKTYDVVRVEYSETERDFTYDMTLSGNNRIRATFLKDGDRTPSHINIRMPGLTAKGTLLGERLQQTAKLYPKW